MSEDQIERQVEQMFNRLDRRLMDNQISQAAYDKASAEISQWAEARYKEIKK